MVFYNKKDIEIYQYYSIKNTFCLYKLQRKQSGPHLFLIKFKRATCITNFLTDSGYQVSYDHRSYERKFKQLCITCISCALR